MNSGKSRIRRAHNKDAFIAHARGKCAKARRKNVKGMIEPACVCEVSLRVGAIAQDVGGGSNGVEHTRR